VPDLIVQPATGPLRGTVPLPGDKSIAHRAFLLAGLARGRSRIVLRSPGEDVLRTLAAMRALGAAATEDADGFTIDGRGLGGLTAPAAPLDCGNSGTTMRLLCGVLAAQRFATTLTGDASLSGRPMARVATPLRRRGARIEGRLVASRVGEVFAPLEVGPLPSPHVLSAVELDLPIPSAQVKSALLLSGLWADGPTVVREPLVSRDHTERMLAALGVPLSRAGSIVALEAERFSGELPAFEVDVPGDPSAAAFVLAAGCVVPGSDVGARGVGLNPTRGGFVEHLRRMGAAIEATSTGDAVGEPMGILRLAHAPLSGATLAGETTLRAIDEVPAACVVAAVARGVTTIADAAELRVKESDRLAAMTGVLRAFGVECEEQRDGLTVDGRAGAPLRPADVASGGDHRIAMAAAVLALAASGPSRVRDVACIATSFPRFAGTLRALGADVRVVDGA
jgi:3-phosphoshikimate 1-carboxyvinyltransferase